MGGYTPLRAGTTSSAAQSTYPLVSWIVTLVLLTANTSLAYAIARKSTTDPAEVVGATVGGLIAWPLILLIIYGLSRKFRERYSVHTVINYGLGLNTIIQAFMSFH